MVFSRPGEPARSDLLDIVSVLDRDTALERAATLAAARTGAATVVLALHDAPGSPVVVCRGIGEAEALELRQRVGTAGLELPPGTEEAVGVVRLADPRTGGEVLRLPIVVGRRVCADLLLTDPPGGSFGDPEVDLVGVLGRVAGVAVRNAMTYEASERRREAGEATARLDEVLHRAEAEPAAWTRVAEGAARIAGADLSAVVRPAEDDDRPGTDVAAVLGDHEQLPALLERFAGRLEEVRRSGGIVEEVGDDGQVVVLAPLSSEVQQSGVVVLLLHPRRARWAAEDRGLLGSFVEHASLVLDRVTLQAERQRTALADDRDRIARDLHDVVIQRLVATGLRLRALVRGGGDGVHGDAVAGAATDLDASVRDIRTTIFDLERRDRASLRADVLDLAHEYEAVLGFSPRVRTWGPVDSLVDRALADHATAVLREALSNCARHAGASRCQVDLGVESDRLHLVVVDDGRGAAADPGSAHGSGNGLRNLAARAGQLGGTLTVEAAEGGGTRLHWQVPLEGQAGSSSSGSGTG